MNAQAEQVSVDNVELGQISNAVVEMNRVETGLALMRKNYANLIVDPTTPTGMEMAKAARAAIREPRYLVERIRKAAKAPLLALGKKLDSEAARITSELMKLETPIHDAIVKVENQQERERLAKLAAEEKRKSDLQARVIELRGNPSLSANDSPDLVAQHIADLEAIPIGEDFAEFTQQATDAKAGGLARLRAIHAAAIERLAEQERIKAERAELARLREEAAERDRQTAARLAEEERIRREAQAKADAEAKAERDRLAAEAEEIRQKQVAEARAHAQKLAEDRAEADRLAAVRQAELDVQAAQLAAARAAVEREREALTAAQTPEPDASLRQRVQMVCSDPTVDTVIGGDLDALALKHDLARTPAVESIPIPHEAVPAFYRVEPEGAGWSIAYIDSEGDEILIGTTWDDEEVAVDVCELMNMAFEAGVASVARKAEQEARQ